MAGPLQVGWGVFSPWSWNTSSARSTLERGELSLQCSSTVPNFPYIRPWWLILCSFFHLPFLTWLSEDVWVGNRHSSGKIVPSVLSFKLPRYKLGLLGLKHIEQFKKCYSTDKVYNRKQNRYPFMEDYTLQTEKVKTNILKKDVKGVKICNSCRRELNECHVYRRQMLWSHLKHCSGSHALSEMQQSVGVQTTWGVHLPDQRWSILRFDKGTECKLWTQKGSSSLAVIIKIFMKTALWWLMPDLVFAIVVTL